MRLPLTILAPGFFAFAALLSLLGARITVGVIEGLSADGVSEELVLQGYEWATVSADGLQVVLEGTAPDEAARFRALSAAGSVVDAARVIDNMTVPEAQAIKPPRFSLEILRNNAGISMIGLIPADTDIEAVKTRVTKIARTSHVTDLMEKADYAVPKNWQAAMTFSLEALDLLPRSKISMDAGHVAITAIADSADQKASWEKTLKRIAPRALLLSVDISAPRPVITPFTLRFLIDDEGARFDACSAHDTVGRALIVSAAREAGTEGEISCTIGLGVPSPDWSSAVVAGVGRIAKLGGGSITFSDVDVTFVAPEGLAQAEFDRVAGELEADLPEIYSLHSVLPDPVKIDGSGEGEGPPEFVATRSPEGNVQMRGRLTDELQRAAAESFARARFGTKQVYAATRLDEDLPEGWPTRVLAALDVLTHLNNGAVVVQPTVVDVRGTTGDPDASATISRILSEKLGASQNFQVTVKYEKKLDPKLGLPTAQECVSSINGVLNNSKITFAPGSANIEASAADTIDKIVDIMKKCADVRMEIAGYTDSQGREEMNRSLSQNRAQAVLGALLARRVLTSNLTAKGFGEEDPIADNGTEEGREANRRIEFRLMEAVTPEEPAADAAPVAETKEAVEAAPDGESAAVIPPAEAVDEAAAEVAAAAAPPPEVAQPAEENTPEEAAQPNVAEAVETPDTPAVEGEEGEEATPEATPAEEVAPVADPANPPVEIKQLGEGDLRPLPRPATQQ